MGSGSLMTSSKLLPSSTSIWATICGLKVGFETENFPMHRLFTTTTKTPQLSPQALPRPAWAAWAAWAKTNDAPHVWPHWRAR
jgi:hypothetical protein